MRSLRVHREVERRESRRALGVPPASPRIMVPQGRAISFDPEILALPQKVSDLVPIQTADGGFVGMFGFSTFDGPDVFA